MNQDDPATMTKSAPAYSVIASLALAAQVVGAQLPSYTANVQPDLSGHDGKLRWAVGVQNVQVIRSAANNPSLADGHDTIYRHHQFLAYWGGLFWVMHDGAGTRVAWSTNGLDWSPAESSPIFDGGHHRMAFYVAPNGRFLASHYRGTRNGGLGVRVVREIHGPNSYGPIFNIKTNHLGAGPYRNWPWYATSPDRGFVAACEALRNDTLFRQQWQEEDQDPVCYTGQRQAYTLRVEGVDVLKNASFREATATVERLVFRTGEFQLRDFTRRRHTEPFLTTRLPNADVPEPTRQFDVDKVTLATGRGAVQQP